MTDVRTELQRLVDHLPQTDPRSDEYLVLLRSIECCAGLAETIAEIIDQAPSEQYQQLSLLKPSEEPNENAAEEPNETAAETAAVAPKYSPEQVRAALVEAKGRGVNLKPIFAAGGGTNFNNVKPELFGDMMATLAELSEES